MGVKTATHRAQRTNERTGLRGHSHGSEQSGIHSLWELPTEMWRRREMKMNAVQSFWLQKQNEYLFSVTPLEHTQSHSETWIGCDVGSCSWRERKDGGELPVMWWARLVHKVPVAAFNLRRPQLICRASPGAQSPQHAAVESWEGRPLSAAYLAVTQ